MPETFLLDCPLCWHDCCCFWPAADSTALAPVTYVAFRLCSEDDVTCTHTHNLTVCGKAWKDGNHLGNMQSNNCFTIFLCALQSKMCVFALARRTTQAFYSGKSMRFDASGTACLRKIYCNYQWKLHGPRALFSMCLNKLFVKKMCTYFSEFWKT